MEPLIIYLLKANVVISILFLFYLFVLKNDKSFWQNRFYLLFSLLLSLFLPFLPELSFSHLDTIQRQITTANPLNSLYTTIGNSQMVNTHVNTAYVAVKPGFTPPSLMQTLVGAYLLVSFVLLIRLFIKLLKISILIKKTDKQFTGGIYYCAFDGTAPFSFFNYLVILLSRESVEMVCSAKATRAPLIGNELFRQGTLRCNMQGEVACVALHYKFHLATWLMVIVPCCRKQFSLPLQFIGMAAENNRLAHVQLAQCLLLPTPN